MKLFSERFGYNTARKALQYECMDAMLRMALYNVAFEWLSDYYSDVRSRDVCRSLWSELWHLPLDEFPEPDPLAAFAVNGAQYSPAFFKPMKDYLLKGKWFWPYDQVEFMANQYQMLDEESVEESTFQQVADAENESLLDGFAEDVNKVLAQEMSAYRLIGTLIVPITNDAEISSLEQCLSAPDSFSGVRMHMGKAIEHYSLRPEADLANTIKESISAVEAAARIVAGSEKDTLDGALKRIGGKGLVHPALIGGWSKLFGFTSDVGGIRHASNTEELAIDRPLAKYMLVSCSAFANYLMELGTLDGKTK